MGSIGNNIINTFVDGQVVSATGSTGGSANALNPKMQIIQVANDDNNTRIGVLEGQVTAITGSVRYNVKSSPFNAVGNGIVDDTAAIQAAITQASANKGTVVFPTGTYKITNSLTIAGNCALVADGVGTGVVIRQYTASKETFYITGSNVIIQDLNIDTQASPSSFSVINNRSTIYSSPISNILIQRCSLYSSNASLFNAIEIRYCTSAVVKDCTFTNSESSISFMSCVKSTISGNTFTGSNGSITLYRTTGLSLTLSPQCTSCIIENNIISNDRSNSIYAISPKNCMIRGNYIISASLSNSLSYAIRIISSRDELNLYVNGTYITVSKNTVDNSGWVTNYLSALYIERSIFVLIEGNMFNEVSRLYVLDCISTNIIGNQFTNMYLYGIYLDNISGDIVISSNGFTDVYASVTAVAIYVAAQGVRPVTIVGNGLYRGSKSASAVNTYGVFSANPLQGYTNISVSGNSFKINAGTEAYASSSSTVFCYYYEEPTGDRVFLSPNGSYPTSGTWQQGDRVVIQSPTAGGYIGYVCTTAGTSGTWKGYGTIQA